MTRFHLRQRIRDLLIVAYAKNKPSYAFWAPLVTLGLVCLWNYTILAQKVEYLTVNLRFSVRAPFDPPADPRLLFVGIDQPTLDNLGAWPWPRNVEANFLNYIAKSGMNPNVVAFDVLLTDDFDKFHYLQLRSGQDVDQLLGDAAGLLPSVITGACSMRPVFDPEEQAKAIAHTKDELTQPSPTTPFPHVLGNVQNITGSEVAVLPVRPLRAQSFFGFINDDPWYDGVRHTLPFLIRVGDKVYPSLSLQVLCQMLNIDSDKVRIVLGQSIVLTDPSGKSWTIPINEKGEVEVNYRRSSSFQNISFYKLFAVLARFVEKQEPLPPDPECHLDKKTILIAGSAIGVSDLGPTPLGVNVPLGFIHLNVINNVLRNDYIRFVPRSGVMFVWLLVAWLTFFKIRKANIIRAVVGPFLIVAVYNLIAVLIFWRWNLQIDMAWPTIAFLGVTFGAVTLRWQEESRGREKVKKTFGQMMSPDLVNHLLEDAANLKLGGSKRPVTILFSDIRSFTTLSESTENEELVRQLNHYFDRMVKCILDFRGNLHGFTGDGIMAVWGDVEKISLGPEGDALNAVRAAIKMRHKLVELNQERALQGLNPLRIGIGLNHGAVVVGMLGAEAIHIQFSVIGDTVNTASRIEGVTKEFHTDLAIGENLRNLLGDEFIVRRLGRIQLKGKKKAILAYEVLAETKHPEQSAWKADELAQYESAFDLFLDRHFAEAEAGFLACRSHHPDDHCVEYYLKGCRTLAYEELPEGWDGRLVMETK